jgi:hypothetical protein
MRGLPSRGHHEGSSLRRQKVKGCSMEIDFLRNDFTIDRRKLGID